MSAITEPNTRRNPHLVAENPLCFAHANHGGGIMKTRGCHSREPLEIERMVPEYDRKAADDKCTPVPDTNAQDAWRNSDQCSFMTATTQVYSRRQAANYLSVGIRTVDALIKSEDLPAARIGRVIRIRVSALDAFLRERESVTVSSQSGGNRP